MRFLGLFLPDSQWPTVPHHIVRYVAAQLSVKPALWQQYITRRRPTISEHRTLIRQRYGYRDFNDPAVQFSTRLPDDNYYEILLKHYNQFRPFGNHTLSVKRDTFIFTATLFAFFCN